MNPNLDHSFIPLRRLAHLHSALIFLLLVFAAGCCADALGKTPPSSQTDKPHMLLIVYSHDLESVANDWAAYRQITGWQTQLLDAADCFPHTAGPDMYTRWGSAIQTAIRERFSEGQKTQDVRGSRFAVLLLGDVPPGMGWDTLKAPHTDGSRGIPTWYHPLSDADLAALSNTKTLSTDNDYQLADDRDDKPDFMLGRVPADCVQEAAALLAKIKRYETAAPIGPWRKRITYIAGEGHFGPWDTLLERLFISMVNKAVPYSFDISMTYANLRSPYCAPPEIFERTVFDRINEGALLLNYLGHGAPKHFDWLRFGGRVFPICDVNHLAENLNITDNRYPIMLIVACWTGMYDMPDGSQCLSEAMLFNDRGPVAIISASRPSHPYANALLQKGVTQQICLERRPTIGLVDLLATRELLAPDQDDQMLELLAAPIARSMHWSSTLPELRALHVRLYNLLGDPTMRIAYPSEDVTGLTFDPRTGIVQGRVPGMSEGTVRVTIESPREMIPRASELQTTSGADDPDFEAKANHNYAIANDKVIAAFEGKVVAGGFLVHLTGLAAIEKTYDPLADRPDFNERWIKVYAQGDDKDAIGSLRWPLRITQSPGPAADGRESEAAKTSMMESVGGH